MRILAIRGHNLASLEAPFEVDLDAEPLRSAGLFAITGKMGAGKSTILDTMCLALFGDCSRLSSAGINDDVPDASGESIKSRDARAILRRGAASGEAQVDFLADDGARYRAIWTARRARGRADGRLQNVERSLIRLADGQILETQIRAVNERVVALVGLTYEEFRRSVLLAQGDFDAFLRADTADRAALLEKVTQTHVYRLISKEVYDRDARARAELDTLEARLGENRLMPEEELQTIRIEIDQLTADLLTAETRKSATDAGLRRHDELDAAAGRVRDATTRLETAHSASKVAAPDRERIVMMDRLEPVRADHLRHQQAVAAQARAERAAERAIAEQQQAGVAHGAALTASGKATNEHEAQEASFREFGPIWSEATRLDGQIATAGGEAGSAKSALELERRSLAASEEEERRLSGLDDTAKARKASADTGLAKLPGFGGVADGWERINATFIDRASLTGQIDGARTTIARLDAAAIRSRGELDQALAVGQSEEAAIADLDLRIEPVTKRIGELEADGPDNRLARLLRARAIVSELHGAAFRIQETTDRLTGIGTRLVQAGSEQVTAAAEQATATDRLRVLEASESEIRTSLERAEVALGQHAQILRAQLSDTEPCPVCGSTEHPNTDAGPFRAMADDIRTRLAAARQLTAACLEEGRIAGRKLSQAEASIASLSTDQDRARADQARAEADWGRALDHEDLADIRKLIPDRPDTEALSTLLLSLDARKAEIDTIARELADQRQAHGGIVRDRAIHAGRLETARKAIDRLRTGLEESERGLALAKQAEGHSSSRRDDIDGTLAGILAPARVGKDALIADPEGIRTKVEKLVEWHRQQTRALDAAEREISDLAPRLAAAKAAREGLLRRHGEAEALLRSREAALEALRKARSGLLDGEVTETHRSRHNTARLAAAEALRVSGLTLSGAAADLAASNTAVTATTSALREAEQLTASSAAQLQSAIGASGIEASMVDELLRVPASDTEAVRARLKRLDEDLASAQVQLKQREGDLEESRAAGIPELSREELAGQAQEIGQRIRTDRERLGVLSGQIQRNDADRQRLRDLVAQIDEARQVCSTWSAVNAAVGSAAGGKFARVAQSVTLAVLVDHANDHLALFNPRYRLAMGGSDLALHVIDLDMADEVRSTRSLSGGESFLVSLALALALSGLGRRGGLAETLFIDEGFGSLDKDSLDMAIEALEALQGQGRAIGVISHVEAMQDRIPVQIQVSKAGAGRSTVSVQVG